MRDATASNPLSPAESRAASTGVPHRGRRAVRLGLALTIAGWLAAFAFMLWHLRDVALDNGLAQAVTQARNFEEHLTQTIQVVDLTAGSIDVSSGSPADLGRRLVTALRPAPFLRSISLVDAKGRVIASSNPENLGTRIAGVDFYPDAPPQAEVIRIGMPWRGRDFADGRVATRNAPLAPDDASFIPVMRPLRKGGETLTVVAALNPDYFINHFSQLLNTTEGYVQWLRYDGPLLVSSRPTDRPGAPSLAGPLVDRVAEREQGRGAQTLAGGHAVLSAYRASSRFPAVVAVHIDREQALEAWGVEARRLSSIVLPVLVALAVIGGLLIRRQERLDAQRTELERERRLAASVFHASSDAVVLTTPEGNILSANPAFERIAGYPAAEVIGRNPRLLASGMQDREFYRRMWDDLVTIGHWQGEIVNRRKDGSLYTGWLTINAVRDEENHVRHYVGVTTDITERKRYETELLEAKERSEAAALAKTTFLATMSHEIRTPMNGIVGMAELMLMCDPTEEQREQLGIIKHSADSLLALLNEILDYSKIEAQGIRVESIVFDPAEVLNDIVGLFAARAQANGLGLTQTIDPALPRQVVGDPTRLRQVLVNLVSNALKFTHEGGINLAASREEAGDNIAPGMAILAFTVTDTGIGIPEAKQEMIFDPFSQADGSTTRKYGGTGLGLAISRRLAEAMGGRLTVSSRPGEGSRFVLEILVALGAAPPAARAGATPSPDPSVPRRLQVLVAEDTPASQIVLRGLLQKLGHHVDIVEDGRAAVEAVAATAYDLILMDMHMPVMDGVAATRAIRLGERGDATPLPIVAITANAFPSDRDTCLAAGMNAFLTKPVSLDQLKQTLADVAARAA